MPLDSLTTYVFIDAAYLRRELDDIGVDWRRLNLASVGAVALKCVGRDWQAGYLVMARVLVYDSVRDEEEDGQADVEQWLRRVDRLPDTHVRRGFLAGDPVGRRPQRQKAVDVQMAVDAMNGAFRHVYEAAVFVTGDGDFTPLVEGIRDQGPLVGVAAFESALSAELRIAADRIGFLSNDPNAWKGWSDLPD